MTVDSYIKMFLVLLLFPWLLGAAQTLTIDSQLGTSIEDCFERISIGEQLPPSAIYRNVSELTTQECETICKQDKQCQTYDYGVGAKGNATCNLSNLDEKELKESNLLRRHPDYDIYVRRFQCEQSPPTPLQPQLDDPGDGLLHRPVFRPEIDEKRPLADEYLSDLRPFETFQKPISPYRPYNNQVDHDRPDDYDNLKPVYDKPPSYGAHKPQDIPYKPQRPLVSPKPDPLDIFYFQTPYGRPQRPQDLRPDPYYPPSFADDVPDIYGPKPIRPNKPNDHRPEPYRPEEKPNYHYINRPNRKPVTQTYRPEEPGYNVPSKPIQDYPMKPDPYGSSGHPGGPVGPPDRPYRPNRPYDYPYRPHDKPSYSYHDQYASNYGQNSYNQDNAVYVEIYDPPRPHKPPKRPLNNRPYYEADQGYYGQGYGYGNQGSFSYGSSISSQNSYSQSQSNSHYYGSGNVANNGGQNYNRPLQEPQRPGYGNQDNNYGSQTTGYGSSMAKPQDSYHKPSSLNQGSYGSKPGYANQDFDGYGSIGTKPQHSYHKPSYNEGYHPYKPSYSNQGSYNNKPGYGNQDIDTQSYSHGSTSKPQSSYYKPSYSNQGSYGSKPDYGHQGYDSQSSGYGSTTKPQGSYHKPSYGNQGSYGTKPDYGNQEYDSQSSGYGSATSKPQNTYKPSYSSNQGYGTQSYDQNSSYGSSQSSFGNSDYYGSRPDYERPQNSGAYGNTPSYGSHDNKPGYGSAQNSNPDTIGNQGYGGQNSYGNQQTRPTSGRPSRPSYGEGTESYGGSNQSSGYGERPDVKPVYEYELEKPGNVPSYIARPDGQVVTSRPVTISDYEAPGYGRDPGRPVSYKACFRRVLAGQRALRSHVRRVVPCETLEDCRRECAIERRFHCESFNYRLDPGFRGKGICELMTKPIEAFDLRRDFVEDKDYDFYEIDRNSLEPNCPETLRGPGLLHSGFLSSKPSNWAGYQNKWSDRFDWHNRYHRNWDRYYEDRRGHSNYGSRRYEDQFFVPYQIGVGRGNDDQENWGQYGGYYGGNNYYKDRDDYHKSINHWRLSGEKPYYGVRPYENTNFNYHSLGRKIGIWGNYGSTYGAYGSNGWNGWNNSGADSWNGLDYGESTYYKPSRTHFYEPEDRSADTEIKDCSSRRRPGMSLSSGAIRRSLITRNVVECEAACFQERQFKCVSYSFRYSTSIGTDNCFLSERPYKGLELSADSGSDVYGMPHDQGCAVSNTPWVESECFWHVRSGAAVSGSAVSSALTVAGLGACEAECLRARGFFCRGFSFRFDSPTIGDEIENCLLTSSPPTSLEISNGLRSLGGHELYARGNYGRGCEPALYDDIQPTEKQCYLQYDSAARLIARAVRGRARVRDERECGHSCTHAPFRCLSFSYSTNAPADSDNCLLSEIRLFDLQQGVDYQHSSDDWLFAFDLFNGRCWRKVYGKDHDQTSPELPHPFPVPVDQTYPSGPVGPGYPPAPERPYIHESGPPSGPGYNPVATYPADPDYKEVYRPSHPSIGYKPPYTDYPDSGFKPGFPPPKPPGYLPEPNDPGYKPGYLPGGSPGYKPAYLPEPSDPGFKPGYLPAERPGYKPGYLPNAEPGYKPGYLPEPNRPEFKPGYLPGGSPGYLPGRPGFGSGADRPDPGYPGDREELPIAVSWRHYTVSGFPCRRDTACAQNQVAGHWACEPEGGEIGSWDYCCSPTHRCGYSEGFHKPWCYVGPSEDQWRPCSEKYYPYHHHNVPHPSQGHREDHRRPNRPWQRPGNSKGDRDRPLAGPYLSEADRKYWDELYKNGPQAYYDKYGNPLPGYARVPTAERPYIKFHHNYPTPGGGGHWVPVSSFSSEDDPQLPGTFGAPRYWPVAYLHKGPPPNMTYFRYNETKPTTTENYDQTLPKETPKERNKPDLKNVDTDNSDNNNNNMDKKRRDEKNRNITNANKDMFQLDTKTVSTTPKLETKKIDTEEEDRKVNNSNVETIKPENVKDEIILEDLKGIDGKLEDFSKSIEVLDIEDANKGEKSSDLKSLEAEERQIEAIGRLLASRRGDKLVLEKRSQKELEARSIAVDQDLVQFNFGNKFPVSERRGTVQKVSKDEIENERNRDRSLEVSETSFVRPPRVLSTTDNIRKAVVNGKIFYDATIREQRELLANSSRKTRSRALEDFRAPSVLNNTNFGKKKVIRPRNVNPVRRVKRVYRKRYNPEEVRKRLLERERSKAESRKV